MTTTDSRFRPARHQTDVPPEQLITSADAGFLIHRCGQLRQEFRTEGLAFAAEMGKLINPTQIGYVSVFLYEELLGTHNQVHWLVHLKQPNDYRRLLDMVDHDAKWRAAADMDRLPAKGGGGWDRLFVEGSIRETIICPQHGLGHGDHHQTETFQPAARFQTTVPADRLLHSGNSALTVHRVLHARYAVREEARLFAYEWASRVNIALEGIATAFLYEEMWGRQDRLHILIHLSSLDAYRQVMEVAEHDPGIRELQARQWVPGFKGGGGWERLFTDGTIADTVWSPVPFDP
ncbi:DUF6039 family protein [Sphaerimonospora sp. CA-214678]|uniref:DUF6039 family protein n=1 Tax=Sphaerimonospora sp. CA-214678 TaxID=3240029 RepID=UPI003D92979C